MIRITQKYKLIALTILYDCSKRLHYLRFLFFKESYFEMLFFCDNYIGVISVGFPINGFYNFELVEV